jgi:eukaryotic-like serine/threonine-protein kinase
MSNMSEPVLLNNRYRLEERLGSGGMAEVYRAHDLTLERIVAIKILRHDYSQSAEFRTRFHHEAKSAANLSHPNIVTVHDFGFSANQLFIVMEYVPGKDLKTLIKERRRFSIQESIDLVSQACAALGYAHRAGLVHCDVKPQNILVTPDRRLKVADFGIARALATISPDERSEVVWGSPQYFSPEQAAGNAPSPASDVYSLGVIFYEMLTGRLPFTASTPQELARMHRESLPPSPRRFNPSIPVALEQIILKVLSKEPAARYRTADQFGQVLRNLEKQLGGDQPGYQTPSQVTTLPPVASSVASSRPVPSQPVVARPKQTGAETIEIVDPDSDLVFVTSAKKSKGFDTMTWFLALLAFLLLGGLIPFWLWVYYVLNPPV